MRIESVGALAYGPIHEAVAVAVERDVLQPRRERQQQATLDVAARLGERFDWDARQRGRCVDAFKRAFHRFPFKFDEVLARFEASVIHAGGQLP